MNGFAARRKLLEEHHTHLIAHLIASTGLLRGPVRHDQLALSHELDRVNHALDHLDVMRQGPQPEPPPNHEVTPLGPVPDKWAAALVQDRRIQSRAVLDLAGVQRVRARFRDADSGAWKPWREYIGFEGLGGSWKLWSLSHDLSVRVKLNAGPGDLIVSPSVRAPTGEPIARLWDVEGEGDFLAALEGGALHIITATSGALSLKGHERHLEHLRGLRVGEVCIVRDLDDAGSAGAEKTRKWWLRKGVRVITGTITGDHGSKRDLRDELMAPKGPT